MPNFHHSHLARISAVGAAAVIFPALIVAGTAGAATPKASLHVVVSTSSTGVSAAGNRVALGFLVTNTGNATLSKVAVAAAAGSTAVTTTCAETVLLPGADTTCSASYTVVPADVTAGSISVVATASGADYVPATVKSAAAALVVPTVPGGSVPLLPTKINLFTSNKFAVYPFGTNVPVADALGGPSDWETVGTDADGGPVCVQSSTPITVPDTGGVLCLGTGTSLQGQSQPVVAVAVPTPTIELPVECVGVTVGFINTEADPPCKFQAQVSVNGVDWTNAGAAWTADPTGSTGCQTPPAAWTAANYPSTGECDDFGTLTFSLSAAAQYVRLQYANTSGDATTGLPLNCAGSDQVSEPTCLTPAMQVDVEPTARLQANVLVNRIVYQPPGATFNNGNGVGSAETFNATQDRTTETEVSVGNSSSAVSAADTSLGVDASLSAGAAWAMINFSGSATWDNSATAITSHSSDSGNSNTIGTSFSNSIQEPPFKAGGSATAAPWENDFFDLLVGPQYDVWDFSQCSTGVASVDGTTQFCPDGTTEANTAVAPVAVASNEQVTVAQLEPCVKGTASFTLDNGQKLSQDECRQIVAQDPFAGTALGLVPTPAGESPGQAVNPAAVLGDSAAPTVYSDTLPAGGYANQKFEASNSASSSYSATSSMETDVTSVETNKVAVGLSSDVGFGPLFSVSASVGFNFSESNTNGLNLIENYTGSQSFTNAQSFETDVTVNNPKSATSFTEYLDPRYDTLMFQSGQLGSHHPVPTVSSAAPATVTLRKALARHEKLAKNAGVAVSALPLPVAAGQRLRLPSGQDLVTSKAAKAGATTVHVVAAKITTAVKAKASIDVIGNVELKGAGFANGPTGVLACGNATKVPSCKAATNVTVPFSRAGAVLYAKLPQAVGTKITVTVESQAGATVGTGEAYTVR